MLPKFRPATGGGSGGGSTNFAEKNDTFLQMMAAQHFLKLPKMILILFPQKRQNYFSKKWDNTEIGTGFSRDPK